MKRLLFSLIFVVLAVTTLDASPYRYRSSVSFNYFYSSLAPYGEWVELEPDVIVWRPEYVGRNWSPYYEGRWVYTSYGWHWDSYEPFGWAVYHYGRWFYDDWYGWVWMPGYEWAPSWVEFRYDDVYVGWAPLPPYAEFQVGVGIHFTHNWHHHHTHWHFVSFNYFGYDNVNYYVENRNNNQRIFSRTKYRTNYYERDGAIINNSIDRSVVERNSGRKVVERKINLTSDQSSISRTGGNERTINVFRPSENEVKRSNENSRFEVIKSNRGSSLKADKLAKRDNESIRGEIVRKDARDSRSSRERNTTYSRENTNKIEQRNGTGRIDNERKSNNDRNGTIKRTDKPQRNDSPNRTNNNRSYKKPESSGKNSTSAARNNKTSEPATKSKTEQKSNSSTRSQKSTREPVKRNNKNSKR